MGSVNPCWVAVSGVCPTLPLAGYLFPADLTQGTPKDNSGGACFIRSQAPFLLPSLHGHPGPGSASRGSRRIAQSVCSSLLCPGWVVRVDRQIPVNGGGDKRPGVSLPIN